MDPVKAEGATIAAQDPLIGTTLAGRYEIAERLGAGAMGAVYRARQLDLGRDVALKAVRSTETVGADVSARFAREARAMSALTHPNTVRVYDFGTTEEGTLFLAMELLEGEPIGDRLAAGKRPTPLEAVRWTRQLLASLGEAHDKGIIHRDIKPDNLFLADVPAAEQTGGKTEPRIKVLDFGIAKSITGELNIDQFETQDGTVFGTPRYMSPEQCQGKQLDQRSDLYAVGIVLHELLAGAPPFVDKDAVVVMAQHIRETPQALTHAGDGTPLPARLQAGIARALAKSPSARFQSAEEMDAVCEQCLHEMEVLARIPERGRGLAARAFALPAAVRISAVAAAALLVVAIASAFFRGEAPERADAPAQAAVPAPAPAPIEERPQLASVTLQTDPSGAEVVHEGRVVGTTPISVDVDEGRSVRVELRMEGFEEQTLDLTADTPARTVTLEKVPPWEAAEPTEPVFEGTVEGEAEDPKPRPKRKRRRSPYQKF